MESVAYNMPESLRKLNFIRHVQTSETIPDDAELLAKLTEVLCRDLRYWLVRESKSRLAAAESKELPSVPGKVRIFLSHAKADDTDEALAIKEHIQKNTQCEAFFDETDIASGYDYADILEQAVKGESAGLIVIQGDNYADRPWCRKEIRDFLKPVRDPLATDAPHYQFFIPPVVVVQTMKGKQIARTIPELGYSPCVRWSEKAAGFVVTTLLREILFGLFYRILADRIAHSAKSANDEVFINRAPDPVMVSRIIKSLHEDTSDTCATHTVVHPGYGLSKMEMDGLLSAVSGIRFRSFLDRTNLAAHASSSAKQKDAPVSPPLSGKIIALSAGTPDDILSTGQSDEHLAELLTRLLRPLIAAGASILYGGRLPESFRPATPWNEPLNFTGLLLNLLLSERETSGMKGSHAFPRLFLPVAWHARARITKRDIAQWLDICSILFLSEKDTGIDSKELPRKPAEPTAAQLEELTESGRRKSREDHRERLDNFKSVDAAVTAVSLSAMRKKICENFLKYRLPDGEESDGIPLQTCAHILVGGAMSNFAGIMPGVFEEALYAIQSKKPLFIIGACGGAAAVLSKQLAALANLDSPRPKDVPSLFTAKHYEKQERFGRMLTGIKHPAITCNPNDSFRDLWTELAKVHDPESLAALLNNGLTGEENLKLLTATSFGEICDRVWQGIRARISDSPKA
jgi:hypothetical protein